MFNFNFFCFHFCSHHYRSIMHLATMFHWLHQLPLHHHNYGINQHQLQFIHNNSNNNRGIQHHLVKIAFHKMHLCNHCSQCSQYKQNQCQYRPYQMNHRYRIHQDHQVSVLKVNIKFHQRGGKNMF